MFCNEPWESDCVMYEGSVLAFCVRGHGSLSEYLCSVPWKCLNVCVMYHGSVPEYFP